MPSVVLYFHTLHHLYDNLVRASARCTILPLSCFRWEAADEFLWCVDDFNLSKLPRHFFLFFFWFSVCFCFILITDKSSPCPHNNPVFSSVRLIIPALCLFFWCSNLWCCLATGATVTVWSLQSNFFFFSFFFPPSSFLSQLLQRCRLSSQIWVNTNATRSVWVCTTLSGRVPAARHRKCLSERRVCVFVCLPFYLAVERMERV